VRPYTALVSGVLFPLQERLKGHRAAAARRWLEGTQWLDPDRLAALQAERLQRLVQRAERSVPFYQQRFAEAGLTARDLCEPRDLRKLPLLDKTDIRAAGDDLRARDAGPLVRSNTGGSGGEPLVFQLGRERVTHDVAAKWRATRWWGVDFGDPEIVLWGSPIELSAQDRLRGLRDRLLRTRLLPAFAMGEKQLDEFLTAIRRRRPRMLFGYPSALAHVARHARKRGVAVDDLGTEVAFVTAERLYPEQKTAIETAFGCRVANGYGGRDAGFLAHECPHGGLHVTAEDVVLEVVDDQGYPVPAGEPGEVVVTHLASGDFPFIRYRTGDRAVPGKDACPCGRGLPLLAEIQGRATDFVMARDGTVMHGLALIYVLRDLPGIEAFQVVQESLDRTRVRIVPEGPVDEATRHAIDSGLRARLGAEVEIAIEEVPRIPPEPSGKYRYIKSEVAP